MGYTWSCVRYPYPNRSVGSKSSCPISTATSSILTFPANSFTRELRWSCTCTLSWASAPALLPS